MAYLTFRKTACLLAPVLALGCGSSPSPFGMPEGGTDAGTDGATDAGAGGDDATLFGDGGTDGSAGLGCSADLRNVVDMNGVVKQTCPPDQGCAGGMCVAACAAAAAAQGSVGCDYMVATPSFFAALPPTYFSPCLGVFLTNNWPKNVHITVTRAGASYDVTKFGRIPVAGQAPTAWALIPSTGVPPGQVGILFLESDPGSGFQCPTAPALLQATEVDGTGRGQAWHISADVPVSAYDILPFGGASSALPGATLLLPTSSWGKNYVAAVPKQGSGTLGYQGGPQWGQIVAYEDGTHVQIVPTTDLPSGAGVVAAPKNVTTSYTLAAGEYVQWQVPFDFSANPCAAPMEMSGSVIASDKPIAFNGGNGYLCLGSMTSPGGGCDSDHEQIPPVSALGSEYVIAPFNRAQTFVESAIYRIVGAVDGTTLTFDPAVAGAPATIKLGELAEFEAEGAFAVASQDSMHPFYVAQMMPGSYAMGPDYRLGDEDYTNVLPPAQYLSKYVFMTDPTYPTTTFSLVRVKGANGFRDVNVDCLGNVTGWKPVGAGGKYEYATPDILRRGVAVGTCANGPHTVSSDGPFGITVWGLAEVASYGYPAGGNVATINTVVIPPVPR
jgi:hypothetical protein